VNRRVIGLAVIGAALLGLLSLLTVPMLIIGGTSMLLGGGGGNGCLPSGSAAVQQPTVSTAGKNTIPANYLYWYQKVGQQYGIPWTVLAGIGTEESDNGQSTLPGVSSGTNSAGAAGPMQIGVDGAAGDQWGGDPIHPASQVVDGVATDEDGGATVSVYDPADAIASAAKYLIEHGAQSDIQGAIFAYNHADWYVQAVLNYASEYAAGGYTVSAVNQNSSTATCTGNTVLASMDIPNVAVATAIDYAQQQLGKPYLFGGTGPDSFDCSGLVMMAYRAAGIDIPRTSEQQWAWGPRVPAAQVEPGDLVFFAGSDGTLTDPGHVGLVIGHGEMIEAYATGFPIRISSYGKVTSAPGDQTVVGFTRPWAHAGVTLPGASGSPSPGN
jgi:peptidoglycan DL-endopeptidase CwlO